MKRASLTHCGPTLTYYGRRAYCAGADSDWLGNVSLMMRTHLNGIIGMHQLLSATGLTVEQARL